MREGGREVMLMGAAVERMKKAADIEYVTTRFKLTVGLNLLFDRIGPLKNN